MCRSGKNLVWPDAGRRRAVRDVGGRGHVRLPAARSSGGSSSSSAGSSPGLSLAPTLLVAIPFTVLVSFTLNILLRELGAADLSGAGAAFGAVTQIGPLVTVLIVAGAGSTAMCADLGLAHDPRRDRRDGGAGHQPGAAVGDPALPGGRAWWRCC